jgi:macrolide transport system ATP-binding/permease protein
MFWMRRVAGLYQLLLHRQKLETELDAEVNAYFETLIDRYVGEGMSREEAHRAARLKFEAPEQVKQKVRNVRIGATLEATLQDLRFGTRMLRKSPMFALVAVCSLAIGIGANSAIYSFADWWLLRPLPVLQPARVVAVVPLTNALAGSLNAISYLDYVDLRDHNRSFQGLVAQAYSGFGFAPGKTTLPRRTVGMFVSGNFLQVLGVEPVIGRAFRREEDEAVGRNAVVIISHDLWASEYASRVSVIGEKLRLNGIEFTIIGVTPASFTGTDQFLRPAVYVPLAMAPAMANANTLNQRQTRWLTMKGRLKPGVGIGQAQADLNTIADALRTVYPRTDGNLRLKVESQLQFQTEFSPPTTAMLVMLALLALCVLLVACANVAGLLLSRSSVRAREMALRLALGAGRNSLVRQLMVENLLLSITGGAAGLAIAFAGVKFFNTLPPPSSDVPFRIDIQLDSRALLFTAVVSIVSTLLFGLVPARRTTQLDQVSALRSVDASSSDSLRLWGRKLLVGGQVALSLVLLIVSGGLVEGFRGELNQGPGFRTDHLFLMSFDSDLVHYTDAQRDQFYNQLLEKTRLAPNVQSATLVSIVPLALGAQTREIVPEGYPLKPGQDALDVLGSVVSDGYFQTLGIPIVHGRGFLESDNAGSPAVAIVNEQFAQHYWPNESPLGKHLHLRNAGGKAIEIVGIAKTTKYVFISEAPLDFVYLPFAQNQRSQMTLVTEAKSPDVDGLGPLLKKVVQGIDPNMPAFDARSMRNLYVNRAMKTPKLITNTVAWLAAMALILAVVGLYGLMAYSVGQRTREIGIRMALGADRREVVSMFMRQGIRVGVPGIGVGLVIGFTMYRAISSTPAFNFEHPGILPFAAISLLLLLTIAGATYIPARHASRIDPMRALRDE